jgi:hypothetical protein
MEIKLALTSLLGAVIMTFSLQAVAGDSAGAADLEKL